MIPRRCARSGARPVASVFPGCRSSARVPRRYRCQPDLEIAERVAAAIKKSGSGTISDAEREAISDAVVPWLVPSFTSLALRRSRLWPAPPERARADPRRGGRRGGDGRLSRSFSAATREQHPRAAARIPALRPRSRSFLFNLTNRENPYELRHQPATLQSKRTISTTS